MRCRRMLCFLPLRRPASLPAVTGGIHGYPVVVGLRWHFDEVPSSSTPASFASRPVISKEDRKVMPWVEGGSPADAAAASKTYRTEPAHEAATAAAAADGGDGFEKTPPRGQPSAESSPTARYAPWEIRALLLPLIPLGGATVALREVIHLLPTAAREEMQRDGGSPLAYVRQHFSEDVIVRGVELSRRTVDLDGVVPHGGARQAAPPPPPPPLPSANSSRAAAQRPSQAAGGAKTVLEVLDTLVEFIPTFFVQQQMVSDQLPSEVKKQYVDSSFLFYIKRFRHYIDIRAHHGSTEIRLRPDFAHPKRGAADTRYATGLSNSDMLSQLARGRRPPRNSEANLIHFIIPRIPSTYTPLATVLQDVSDIVSRHPSFDPRLGVTGLFEKYPEYFQIVDSKLRVRPFHSAPNSLDDLNATTSPLPTIYAKIKQLVDEYAEGKDYTVEAEKAAAVVPTGKLYALLNNTEKKEVKTRCRSFPRFLRLHGEEIVVSVDNMKVYQFRPTYERCAETIMDQRLSMGSLSPDDPVLKIPAAIDDNSSADWAVRELYDALPLMQCAELDEVMSLVPPSVKSALPQEQEKLVEHLALYPDYFLTWPYPDDPRVIVVQRAKLEPLPMEGEDIARVVMPMIPQGGIEVSRLLRRVPLPLQRHFYRHGLKKVLGEMKNYFLIVGEKVMRVG
ncbi:hypothetical protein, conserved [Trypanosoma cruzi]|uniref:Uncharacterized protein n=1 Tax=Trypanosoma cruzi (strain CL Brener) TaxID=353153 RepID=Q4DXB4_TRYCC|nr:hypothetical protein, conserved [Trypanosoma cruzi]EAN97183.1 hypothetical protein, conserved [Trypanosoma cruzi]|eukprot:XP_819034.1 hypothetical protein [Trypanosoma cruzi strain CL Brener]